MGKARFALSHVDVTRKLIADAKKINGLLRRTGSPGTQSSSSSIGLTGGQGTGGGSQGGISSGGGSANSTNVLVKRLDPAAHTVDTADGVAVGWCPNGVRTEFLIVDTDVTNYSVITGNVVYLIAGDNYSVASAVQITLINYVQGTYSGFLVKCSVAPINNESLNYAVLNPSTQQLGANVSTPPTLITGADGGCNPFPTGFIYWIRIPENIIPANKFQLDSNGIIVVIGVKACTAGGHCRFKFARPDLTTGALTGTEISETPSIPLNAGWNDVQVSVPIPKFTPFYDPSPPGGGVIWIGIEFDSSVSIELNSGVQSDTAPHTYGPGISISPLVLSFITPNMRLRWKPAT